MIDVHSLAPVPQIHDTMEQASLGSTCMDLEPEKQKESSRKGRLDATTDLWNMKISEDLLVRAVVAWLPEMESLMRQPRRTIQTRVAF